jgi:hypothetical protein
MGVGRGYKKSQVLLGEGDQGLDLNVIRHFIYRRTVQRFELNVMTYRCAMTVLKECKFPSRERTHLCQLVVTSPVYVVTGSF